MEKDKKRALRRLRKEGRERKQFGGEVVDEQERQEALAQAEKKKKKRQRYYEEDADELWDSSYYDEYGDPY